MKELQVRQYEVPRSGFFEHREDARVNVADALIVSDLLDSVGIDEYALPILGLRIFGLIEF